MFANNQTVRPLCHDNQTFIPRFPLEVRGCNLPPIRPDNGEWRRIIPRRTILKISNNPQ